MTWAIISLNSRKALDIPSGRPENGLPLQQYTFHGGSNQLWELQPTTPDSAAFKIVSQATRKALTVSPGPHHLEDNVQVEQWPIDDQTSGQEWGLQLAGYDKTTSSSIFIIFAYLSGKVLDVRGGSTDDHAVIQQYTPYGTPAQLWILQRV